MIGQRFGVYDIVEEIGRGGMATVYRAYQPSMDRFVAVKVLKRSFTGDTDAMARFQREARLVARLEHPHLLPIYDFDGLHDPPYLVMRYMESGTLKEALRRGRLPAEEAGHLFCQVALALDYAHRHGVVHRDLKPSNIMVDRDGFAYVTDFGLARPSLGSLGKSLQDGLTMPGVILGTPGYMSPEQALGSSRIDHRTDVYSMGVVLFELLTGRPPYAGTTPVMIAMAHAHEPPPPPSAVEPSIPKAVDELVLKAMAKEPDQRFLTMADFARAVMEALGRLRTTAPPKLCEAARLNALEGQEARRSASPSGEATATAAGRHLTPSPASGATPSRRRRIVTSLFASVAEFVETLGEEDPGRRKEELDLLGGALEREVAREGGSILSRTPEALSALWGLEQAREDDAERAVRAGLALREAMRQHLGGPADPLPIQVGVATGPVVLEGSGSGGGTPLSGAVLTLAGRLGASAPPGTVRISSETRHRLRGAFRLSEAQPLHVRAGRTLLETFLVDAAPAAAPGTPPGSSFRTPMLGREEEMALLERAFAEASAEGSIRIVTIVGGAATGKSRLAEEFLAGIQRRGLPFRSLCARATPESPERPCDVLRSLLFGVFGVAGSDGPAGVLEKFREGVALHTGLDGAQSLGLGSALARLAGLALEDSPRGEASAPFDDRAVGHLARFFRLASARAPLVLLLEDVHWIDGASLGLLARLVRESPDLPLLGLAIARPGLFERFPFWGQGLPGHARLDLGPLSEGQTLEIAGRLLAPVVPFPEALCRRIARHAEGIPGFVVEVVRALVDEGVIRKGDPDWTIARQDLEELPVPSTLSGAVRARLDALPAAERTILQRAAVIGRVFWDAAVADLALADGVRVDVRPLLRHLAERELIAPQEASGLAGTEEFVLPGKMVRAALLEEIPRPLLRAYHARAARWLEGAAGERAGEMAAAVASHAEAAGERSLAFRNFHRAGVAALHASAFEEARSFFERALEQADPAADPDASTRLRLGEALSQLGRHEEARSRLAEALQAARAAGAASLQSDALYHLAQEALAGGDPAEARRLLEESLDAAGGEDLGGRARALYGLGDLAWRIGDAEGAQKCLEEGARAAQDAQEAGWWMDCVRRLGSVALSLGDPEGARARFEACRNRALEHFDRDRLALSLLRLAEVSAAEGAFEQAREDLQEALGLASAIGRQDAVAEALLDLGYLDLEEDRRDEARPRFREALAIAHARRERGGLLASLVAFAHLFAREDRREEAAELLGLALNHPEAAASWEGAPERLQRLREALGPDDLEAAVRRGMGRSLDDAADRLLATGGTSAS